MNTFIFTCRLPSGALHSYSYDAQNTEEAMQYARRDIRSDKSSFVSLSPANMFDVVEELNSLDRPMEERQTVYKVCEFVRCANRTTLDLEELQELAVSLKMDLARLHHYLMKITQSGAYSGLLSYTFAVNLQSLYVRPVQH